MSVKGRVRRAAQRLVGVTPTASPHPDLHQAVALGHATVGRRTYGSATVLTWLAADGRWTGGDVHVGAFCSLAGGIQIYTGGEHNTRWATTYPLRIQYELDGRDTDGHPRTRGDVVIGNDVWIGAQAAIFSGVTIGNGAVIGAHAVVDKDVRPYAIVTGNRAVEVGRRFDDQTVDQMLELRWWDWPDEQIVARVDELSRPPSPDLFA